LKVGDSRWVEAEAFENAQPIGGEAIAAAFVSWKDRLVHHRDIVPVALQRGGTRCPGGTCSDDENLAWHESEAIGGLGYVRCDTSS